MVNINILTDYILTSLSLQGDTITPLKLQKILYYIQAWNLVYFKDPLFEDTAEAWVNGPVYRTVYDRFREKRNYDDISINKSNEELKKRAIDISNEMRLDNNRLELISAVLHKYGTMSTDQLVFRTHAELPWNEARRGLEPFIYSERPISHKSMESYYSSLLKR